MTVEISWMVGVGWAIFCLFLIGLIWRRDDMHYEKQEEEYLARLKEEQFQEAMKKRADPKERNGNDKDRP